jgi:hypothetical protein
MIKIWHKLDEVIGAVLLTSTALVAMYIGYDSSIAQMSITGIVALLAVKAVKPGVEENGQ